MRSPPAHFRCTERIASVNENSHNRVQGFNSSCEAPTAPHKNGNITPQISIHVLNGKRIVLVMEILHVFAGIYDVFVPAPTIRIVRFRPRHTLNHRLNPLRRLVISHVKPHNPARQATYHHHQIHILPRFGVGFALDKPVQFVKFITAVENLLRIQFLIFFSVFLIRLYTSALLIPNI